MLLRVLCHLMVAERVLIVVDNMLSYPEVVNGMGGVGVGMVVVGVQAAIPRGAWELQIQSARKSYIIDLMLFPPPSLASDYLEQTSLKHTRALDNSRSSTSST